jgi:hypothetical protein
MMAEANLVHARRAAGIGDGEGPITEAQQADFDARLAQRRAEVGWKAKPKWPLLTGPEFTSPASEQFTEEQKRQTEYLRQLTALTYSANRRVEQIERIDPW